VSKPYSDSSTISQQCFIKLLLWPQISIHSIANIIQCTTDNQLLML